MHKYFFLCDSQFLIYSHFIYILKTALSDRMFSVLDGKYSPVINDFCKLFSKPNISQEGAVLISNSTVSDSQIVLNMLDINHFRCTFLHIKTWLRPPVRREFKLIAKRWVELLRLHSYMVLFPELMISQK